MYYLIVGGIIVSNFISQKDLKKELQEINEIYRNKAVEVRKHTQSEVNQMVWNFNKPYTKELK